MELKLVERSGNVLVEGIVGRQLLHDESDAVNLIEFCFNHRAKRVLLYAENLTDRFFDLSSLEAGSILQKLRNYEIRLAVVWSQNSQSLSSAFRDLLLEENRGKYFRIFKGRDKAEAWLLEFEQSKGTVDAE